MNYIETTKISIHSSWIVLKLVIPIYILSELFYFYNILDYVSFVVEPWTSVIGLPKEASLAIISGMFLNLYAAVAFAAPLDMTAHQWSILAVFLGICHSLVVEGAILKQIGISNIFSYSFRLITGFFGGFVVSVMPSYWFDSYITSDDFVVSTHDDIWSLLQSSAVSSVVLSAKIIVLITALIFLMDFIKSREFFEKLGKNITVGFSLIVGIILGITYGAGVLIKEAKRGNMSKKDIYFIAIFLMICHAIVEDTLLFVIFGADFFLVIIIRTVFAVLMAYGMILLLTSYNKQNKKDKL